MESFEKANARGGFNENNDSVIGIQITNTNNQRSNPRNVGLNHSSVHKINQSASSVSSHMMRKENIVLDSSSGAEHLNINQTPVKNGKLSADDSIHALNQLNLANNTTNYMNQRKNSP